jgi:hypothetical protein
MPLDDNQVRAKVKDNATAVGDIAAEIAKEMGLSEQEQAKLKASTAAAYAQLSSAGQQVVGLAVAGLDKVLAAFISILTKIRTEGTAGLPDTIAEVLNEFLGTDLKGSDFGTLTGGDVNVTRAHQIGAKILARLGGEFVPAGAVTPESGETAAQRFLGFGVNFGIQTGILALIGGCVPQFHLEEVREMGVQAARNIGLGRLVRQGLRPLVRNTIEQPYDRLLRKRFRPDLLSAAEQRQARDQKLKDEDLVRDEMAQLGYKDPDINFLLFHRTRFLSPGELAHLIRYRVLSQDQAVSHLAADGYQPFEAENTIAAGYVTREDLRWDEYISLLIEQAKVNLIDVTEVQTKLQDAPITQKELDLIVKIVQQHLDHPPKQLTWAQVVTAYETGAVDFDYVDNWLFRKGFDDEDTIVMELLLLEKALGLNTKQKVAAAKGGLKPGHGKGANLPPAPPAGP